MAAGVSTTPMLAGHLPPDAQAKREALRRAINLLSNGAAARCFVAWRSLAGAMALKRAAFARKQAAVRRAVAIGDAIVRQRRCGAAPWWPVASVPAGTQFGHARLRGNAASLCYTYSAPFPLALSPSPPPGAGGSWRPRASSPGAPVPACPSWCCSALRSGCGAACRAAFGAGWPTASARWAGARGGGGDPCPLASPPNTSQNGMPFARVCILQPPRSCLLDHPLQAQKRHQAEQAREHHVAALQHRVLAAWRGAVTAAAAEQREKAELAGSFAHNRALRAAWHQWEAWMELQLLRRQRLAALLASLDGGSTPNRQLLVHCWQRWRRAVERGQRLEAAADQLAGRRAAQTLGQVFEVWAAFTRAMRAEPNLGSPFASPRRPGADEELILDLAELMAGGPSSSGESVTSGGSPASSCGGSGAAPGAGSLLQHTSMTVAAAASPAAQSGVPAAPPAAEAGQQQGQRKRWGLGRRLFRGTR